MKNNNKRSLIVAPHPDDETIGAAIWMSRHGSDNITLAHVTDGRPNGFVSHGDYAAARRQELYAALKMIGIHPAQCMRLGFVDQDVYAHLPELIHQLAGILSDLRPQIVFTPAYEGGHPDHDSTALALHLAKKLHPDHFTHMEYRLYHASTEGGWETGDFLPHGEIHSEVLTFSAEERLLKARMAAAFVTQSAVLARFQFVDERFRAAPQYDFTAPPHHGELLYEKFGWGITWADWDRKARQALVRAA